MNPLKKVSPGHFIDRETGRFAVHLHPGLGWRWVDTRTHLAGAWRQTKKEAVRDLAKQDAGRDATEKGFS